jgi:hypothetical protein
MTTNQRLERICAFKLDGLSITTALIKVTLTALRGHACGRVGRRHSVNPKDALSYLYLSSDLDDSSRYYRYERPAESRRPFLLNATPHALR